MIDSSSPEIFSLFRLVFFVIQIGKYKESN